MTEHTSLPEGLPPSSVTAFEATEHWEDSELALAWQTGECVAAERLLERHMGKLIVESQRMWARLPANSKLESEDLLQDCAEQLLIAARRYDPEKNIGHDSLLSLMKHGPFKTVETEAWESFGVRPGKVASRLVKQLRRFDTQIYNALGRSPTHEEISEQLGIPIHETGTGQLTTHDIVRIPALTTHLLGFGKMYELGVSDVVPKGELSTQLKLRDMMMKNTVPSPEDIAIRDDATNHVRECIKSLYHYTAVEAQVLCMRYGIDSGKPMKLSDIAEQLGLSPGAVAHVQVQAENRLKDWLMEVGIHEAP